MWCMFELHLHDFSSVPILLPVLHMRTKILDHIYHFFIIINNHFSKISFLWGKCVINKNALTEFEKKHVSEFKKKKKKKKKKP
jgi:hypothetical protein